MRTILYIVCVKTVNEAVLYIVLCKIVNEVILYIVLCHAGHLNHVINIFFSCNIHLPGLDSHEKFLV